MRTQLGTSARTRTYPPGPRQLTPLGQSGFFGKSRVENMVRLARHYGPISHFTIFGQHLYLLDDAEFIKEVLVTRQNDFHKGRGQRGLRELLGEGLLTSEGELHLRQRRLVQPAFHKQRMAGYASTMALHAQRLCARWREGDTVDIAHDMMQLTLAIAGKTLFDANVEDEADEIGAALTESMRAFRRTLSPLAPLLTRLPLRGNRLADEARARLEQTVSRIIEERRRGDKDLGDLLSMLLSSEDEEGERMSDRQVRDEAMTLLLAGHETTANLLSWTWYLLAQNPVAEARLHAELDRVLGDRPPGLEDVPALPYTNQVLTESMRLYPPAYLIGREAQRDVSIGGYVVPAGAGVLMSQYVTHRNPRYYSEPERFLPERWDPGMRANLPKFAYFPFGGGQRVCIGEPFAWLEGTLVLATLAQRWRPRLVPGHPIELEPLVTLRPRYGIRAVLRARPDAR